MTEFMKTMKRRILYMNVFFVIAILMIVNDQFFHLVAFPAPVTQNLGDFQLGLLLGLSVVLLFMSIRYKKAIKTNEGVEEMYNREKDERLTLIRQKAGVPVMLITSVFLVFCAIIAGYFNATVFYTLLAVAIFQHTTSAVLKLVYMKLY